MDTNLQTAVVEKTLNDFNTRMQTNNENLSNIEIRLDSLINRLKGTGTPTGDEGTQPCHGGILLTLSDFIADNAGSCSRISKFLNQLEEIA